MQDAQVPVTSGRKSGRSGIFVGGTIIMLIGAGIAMQVWRAQDSQAAEQEVGEQSSDGVTTLNGDVALARVNGEPISRDAVAQECIDRYGPEVLENLINRKIIQQACSDRGLTVSEAEVNQEIIEISKKFGLAVDQWYKMLQAERGLTPVQYHRDVIWPMLALRKLAGKNINITTEMLKMAYEDNYGPRVKARMIVSDNMRRATDIWEKVKANPDEFENLARDYSVEPNSRALGGTIPPIRKNSEGTHENIRRTAFQFKPEEIGAISGIVQVGVNQYVILKYEGRTEPVEHNAEDVKAQLHAELEEREVQKLVGETFESLQKAARVDNRLTGETRGPVEQASRTSAGDDGR